MVYAEVPSTSLRRDSITRDLDKALSNIDRAIEIDPEYPENYLYLAKVLEKGNNDLEAAAAILKAKALLTGWQKHVDYPVWRIEINSMMKSLRKEIKRLQFRPVTL